MPEERKPEEAIEEKKEADAPKPDAFGDNGVPPEPPTTEKKEEKKEYDSIPDDHPTIVALKNQIDAVKNEYGTNLSGQRTVIQRLEAEIDKLSKGKPATETVEVLFKPEEIKWSKDLTKEQREEMTDNEIRQMDEIAAMKESQNKLYASVQKEKKAESEPKPVDTAGIVKEEAKEMARGTDGAVNTELANQIIEAAKMFSFDGLDEATIRDRVKKAAAHVPDYKPPREQVQKKGKTVDGTKVAEDPFGVDKIVEEVQGKKKSGSYSL